MLSHTTFRKDNPAPKAQNTTELRKALADLVPELYVRAIRLSRSSSVAEDLVQDTIERAMRFEDHYLTGTNVRAWVFQILFSVFITRCRRSRRERNALAVLSTDPNAWTVPNKAEPVAALTPSMKRAMETLPEHFRRVVELVDLEEMSYRDAAEVLGVPVGTVMSRLHRGRKQLRAEIAPVMIEAITSEDDAMPCAA
jgi:RNA polymerase sigma-70 factor, ECF subfamily